MILHCKICRADTEHEHLGNQVAPEFPEFDGLEFWNCSKCKATRTRRPDQTEVGK